MLFVIVLMKFLCNYVIM